MTTGIDEEDIERLSADIETISTEKAGIVVSYIEEEISKIISKFDEK
jgi:folylpolyglutamate synthase/dihydropteroate synthase